MPKVTRVSDTTSGKCDLKLKCCPHSRSGTNTTGSPTVFINGLAAHRLNDTGSTNCPHGGTYKSIQGSPTVFVNGLPLTRVGDTTQCTSCGELGKHSSGSETVFAN